MKNLITAKQFELGKKYKIDEAHGITTLKFFWRGEDGDIRVKTSMGGIERIKPIDKFKFYEMSGEE